ncbi:MAG: pyruvate kinase [Acaryochloridaceae cyanobacterium SU_2_1]|nr:pyruvate kinase [Acaryochloridaceae cyanobacterium SU_2_1]
MSESLRRTKIVATVGPAIANTEMLRAVIQAGATTLRLNFSHGTHDDHLRSIQMIRQLSYELNQPVAILQDLQGPKIRLGKFATGPITLHKGDAFALTSQLTPGTATLSTVTYDKLVDEVDVGATILLDDGRVEMKVESIDQPSQTLHCRVVVGGQLSDSKGVNFPGVSLSVKALTDKDRQDLIFGLTHEVDWIALSFVRNPQDVLEIKELIAAAGQSIPVIAKIEKHEAITQMEEILSLCDGVMIARGDLGVELPAQEVPILQKRLIQMANRMGIPVITATQMLDSMVNCPRPTRAEVSDVANAILDGTDAVMLSNEAAVGNYPVEAVATMASIAERIDRESSVLGYTPNNLTTTIPNAISQSVAQVATQLKAKAILTLTKTGATGRNVSKYRPNMPILAVTPHVDVARQLQLVWGVQPLLVMNLSSIDATLKTALNSAQEKGWLEEGDLVVIAAGTLQGVSGSTDFIKVEIVTSIMGQGIGVGQGCVSGLARIATSQQVMQGFNQGEILVAAATDATHVEAMRKAAGIVTEVGGMNSHAAVLGLRLGIPVMVGVQNATTMIRDGTFLTLDLNKGLVYSGTLESG